MKKNKLLALLLTVVMLLSVVAIFSGCDQGKDPASSSGESNTEGNASESETEPARPAETLTIAENGTVNYVIVRPEYYSDEIKDAFNAIRDAISTATGKTISIKEDFLIQGQEPAEFEILLGNTNREESANALADAKYDDAFAVIENKKLVINSYNDAKTLEVANYVAALFAESKDGKVTFSTENEKIARATYPKSDFTICGTSVKDYKIVYGASASSTVEAYANILREGIKNACGYYLPIVKDTVAPTDNEILLGNTNREESSTVIGGLEKYGYNISKIGSRIVIAASDMTVAFAKFESFTSESILNANIEAASGVFEFGNTPILTGLSFSDVHNGFTMLEEPFKIRTNVNMIIDKLLEDYGKVDVVLNGGDYMSDYPSWLNPGALPYQYFLGFKALTIETLGRITKDGKVLYVAGNHDYAQGEISTDGPGKNGSYNAFNFTDTMEETIGKLEDSEKFEIVSTHNGEKYLLSWHYVINGVDFVGISPDPDIIWNNQGYGMNKDMLTWVDNKLDEIDPYGTKLVFVVCHYAIGQRTTNINSPVTDTTVLREIGSLLQGHRNLFYMFGHWHTVDSYHSGYTVYNVIHYDNHNTALGINGTETESTEVIKNPDKLGFTAVWMGGIRVDYDGHSERFEDDYFLGDKKNWGGYGKNGKATMMSLKPITAAAKMSQAMLFEVYEDRVVFKMLNCGNHWKGLEMSDDIETYTVFLAR